MAETTAPFPLLVVGGMSRAGTTFLYHNLGKHPRVFAPRRKEICYFAHNYDHGLDWFRSYYAGRQPGQLGLDVCGHYFLQPPAVERLREFDPEQRVILGLRDPRDWAFSLYEQYAGVFDVPPPGEFFSGCSFRRENRLIRLEFGVGCLRRSAERFASTFGRNLLLFDFGLLGRDPLGLLRAIEGFAELEPWFQPGRFTATKINARGRRRSATFERLLQVPGVADTIARLLPRHLLLALRGWIDARSSRGAERRRCSAAPHYTTAELALIEELFASDAEWMRDLFRESPFRTGDAL